MSGCGRFRRLLARMTDLSRISLTERRTFDSLETCMSKLGRGIIRLYSKQFYEVRIRLNKSEYNLLHYEAEMSTFCSAKLVVWKYTFGVGGSVENDFSLKTLAK